MGIREERNIATLLRWNHEVWGEGRAELAADLLAPTYVRHDPSGVRTWAADDYGAEVAARVQAGAARVRHDEVLARGEYVGLRWTGLDPGSGEPRVSGLQVYQFNEDHRISAMWGALRLGNAVDDSKHATTRWLIADGETHGSDELHHLAQQQAFWEARAGNDADELRGFFNDPNVVHGPGPTRSESLTDFADRIRAQESQFPDIGYQQRVFFAVGDCTILVGPQTWDDATANPMTLPDGETPLVSPWEFVMITRWEDGRISERWQVAATPGVSWDD